MRLVLVLAAVIGLVAALWFALSTDPARPALENAPVAPETRAARVEPAPAPELAQSERSSAAEPGAPAPSARGEASVLRGRIAIAVVAADPSRPLAGVVVEFAEALARTCPLVADPGLVFRAADVPAGEWTVSATANGTLPAVERITVLAQDSEQRFEVRLAAAPTVRVRWQADDGRPIREALAAPGIRSLSSLGRIAVDDRPRAVGDPAPESRHALVFGVTPDVVPRNSQRTDPWPGAPADAVCEFALSRPPPVYLCASIDGAVVGSVAVEDAGREVLFRTPLELLRRLNASVSYCVVDAATQQPIGDARVSGSTRSGIGRSPLDVGPEGCRVDPRFGPGRWMLEFRAPGRASAFRPVDLAPGSFVELGQVPLGEPQQVVVRVRHADGSAAGAVRLSIHPAERVEWSAGTAVSTDPQGEARFGDLPPESHVLLLADPRFARRSVVVQPHPPDYREVIELRAEPGVEVALDFGPQAAGGGRAYLYDGAGTFVADASPPTSGLVPLRLLAGTYTVELEGSTDARAITVTDESVVFEMR